MGLRKLWRVAALVSLALAACTTEPLQVFADPEPQFADDGMPLGPLSGAVSPSHYALELVIDPTETSFSGETVINVTLAQPADHIWMHGYKLDVTSASLTLSDGRAIAASWEQKSDTGSALLTLAETAPAGAATLHFAYTAPFNTESYGLMRQERSGRWYAATQLEPIAARWVFPSFDEPKLKVPFDITVIARTGDAVITNTPEVSNADAGDGLTRHVFAETKPLPTYLIMFAVGPYDVVEGPAIPPNAVRAEPVPLRAAVVAGLGDRLAYGLEHEGAIIAAQEAYFDTPYPYAKLDNVAMPSIGGFGAMENAAAVTYDEYLMLLDENSSFAQKRRYTYVHSHELAHMWFGDLVTPAWWTDIWLNEAFATWMGYKTAATVWPEGQFDREVLANALATMSADSLASARAIRQPVLRDAESNDAFDSITYQKGAGVLRMLEAYVGEDAFRDGVRLHMRRFAYGVATAEDFLASISEGSRRPEVVPAFHSYIDQAGVPLVSARLDCPARGKPSVLVSQSRYAPLGSTIAPDAQLWRIPACISYSVEGASGRTCSLISEREQTIALDAPSCPASIHPNADGAGYYRFSLDAAGWDALAAHAVELHAAEALAAVDSLDAAFRAGAASAEEWVAGMTALSQHPAWDVASAVAARMEAATTILDDAQLAAARPKLAALFRDRYAALEGVSEGGDLLLRTDLARFLAVVAQDEGVRGGMSAQGAMRIGIQGARDWSAVDPNLLAPVLTVGVQDLGSRFFDLVLGELVASDDPAFRRDAIAALAAVEDPSLAERLRETVGAGELRGGESLRLFGALLASRATQADTWAWMQANGETVIALAPDAGGATDVGELGASFCSAELGAEFTAFIEAHAAALPGYERSLAQTQEKIALCTALKAASAEDLAKALASPPG